MKRLTKKFNFLSALIVLVSVPVFGQNISDEDFDRLNSKIDAQITEIQRQINSLYSEFDDEDITDMIDNFRDNLNDLEEDYYDLSDEDNDRSKYRDLKKISDQLTDLASKIAKEKGRNRAKSSDSSTYRYDYSGKNSVNKFGSTTTIETDERINGDVMVTNGDLIVKGQILGDAVAISGDVIAKKGSKITGDAVAIGGNIIKDEGAVILGKLNEISSAATSINYGQKAKKVKTYKKPQISTYSDPKFDPLDWSVRWQTNDYIEERENIQVRYNGAEGFYLGAGRLKNYYWDRDKNFSMYGFLGYAFSAKYFQYQLGYDFWFGNYFRFEVGGEVHDQTMTYDDWILGRTENTFAAFFLHENFFNFHKEKGRSLHIAQYLTPRFRVQAEWKYDDVDSMGMSADWALFGGKKKFVPNQPVSVGNVRSGVLSLTYDGVYNYDEIPRGFYFNTSAEIAGGVFLGDYQYNLYTIEMRTFIPINSYSTLRVRYKAAAAEDHVPIQKMLKLGGIGSLNGYPLFGYVGNRMMLANFEYVAYGSTFTSELPFIFSNYTLFLIDDLGYVGNALTTEKATQGWDMNESTVKNSVGFGFGNYEGTTRLTFSWRTDLANQPVQIMFRWTRPF